MDVSKEKKKIFVLDVHASEAGALSILDDFYGQVKASNFVNVEWTFLVSSPCYKDTPNINIMRYPWIKKSWFHRVFFDFFMLKKIIRAQQPDLIFNLQNKCVGVRDCPQIVYLHLPFILTDFKFDLGKHELRLWFYQKILKKIIFNSYKHAHKVIVQTSWMKDALVSKALICRDKVEVIPPKIGSQFMSHPKGKFDSKNKKIFYPATAFSYKNHWLILKAMNYLKRFLGVEISAEFTISSHENRYTKELYRFCLENDLDVEFLGKIDREEVITKLLSNGLVFPSFVESFGLPLLEARSLQVPILAINMPFSREILKGFGYVDFFNGRDYIELAELLIKFGDNTYRQNDESLGKVFNESSILDAIKPLLNELN